MRADDAGTDGVAARSPHRQPHLECLHGSPFSCPRAGIDDYHQEQDQRRWRCVAESAPCRRYATSFHIPTFPGRMANIGAAHAG